MSRTDDAGQAARPRRRAVRRTPEVTRREILESTAFLLGSRPFRELSVGDIMRHTEVGRSTFYAHFPDVYAVVEVLLSEIRDEEIAYLQDWGSGTTGPRETFEAMITNTVSLWARRGPMISSMLDAASYDGRIAAVFQEMTTRYCDVAAAAIRQGQTQARAPHLDPDEAAALMIHGTQGYLKDRLGTPGRGDPLAVASTLREMWTAALYV